ncbi:serine hydrolase domain-containing protein [Agromyces archimandritae]|uniref:Serine hydrolase n=1 Tax=Agromyces archimandritae TaxID=2781962 RepID=A0A975FJU7_9MICO|nr:serine hydrolase [Agromyces archimandritae]QTX03355.1 serine hydrolase [Agromyces archimandritae]
MAERLGGIRRVLVVGTAIVALIALAGCTSPATDRYKQVAGSFDDDRAAALQGVLEEAVRLSGSSGGIAGVWSPWAGEWTAAVGTESFEEGSAPVTEKTGIRMATSTAAITCTIMLRLAEEDKIDPDAPVAELLRDMPGLHGATPAQLCQNTSGIADYYGQLKPQFLGNPQREWSTLELISNALAMKRTGTAGHTFSYSRGGILLLALALERTTGSSWNSLAERYVFDPLELEHTRLPAGSEKLGAGSLHGYSAAFSDKKPVCDQRLDLGASSSSTGGGAAGAVSTLAELHTMAQAFASGALLSEESAEAQWAAIPMGSKAAGWQDYGLGAAQYGPLRGIAGEVPGALTAVFADAGSGLTVVVALNNSTSGSALVRETAFAMASIGAKADAAKGRERPFVELPWSLEQAQEKMAKFGKCPAAAE